MGRGKKERRRGEEMKIETVKNLSPAHTVEKKFLTSKKREREKERELAHIPEGADRGITKQNKGIKRNKKW